MSIYTECPKCHRKQSMTNETCRKCTHQIKKDRRWNKIVYWVYLRHKGIQVWKRIGESLSRAREEEARIRGRLVDEEYEKDDRKLKIADFFSDYYLPWAKREKGTWAKDEERFKTHLSQVFGNKYFKNITAIDVESYKEKRSSERTNYFVRVNQESEEKERRFTKPATINRELALLKKIFNLAVGLGKYKGRNPVADAGSMSDKDSYVSKALSEHEAAVFLNACSAETKPIFEFALATGIRIGRILSLRWDQIDIQNRIIFLTRKSTKKETHTLPLSEWALDIIKNKPRHLMSPFVFCHLNGQPFKELRHGFKKALKRAGLDPTIRIHDLRHTYDTWLHARGTPTAIVKDMMGQKTMTMASHYNQSSHETMLHFANKIVCPTEISANHIANNQ
jgi:integrase